MRKLAARLRGIFSPEPGFDPGRELEWALDRNDVLQAELNRLRAEDVETVREMLRAMLTKGDYEISPGTRIEAAKLLLQITRYHR